jgi:hypothetical protein
LKWKKLGKIFDPARFKLPNNCEQFAQAPQALAFDRFTRVYFSSRERDPNGGKYLSHVCFADFSNDFRQIIRVSDRSVIELGKLGCFDEHGIFPMNVLRHSARYTDTPADGAVGPQSPWKPRWDWPERRRRSSLQGSAWSDPSRHRCTSHSSLATLSSGA